MKMRVIVMVLAAQFLLIIGVLYPCSVVKLPQREVVRSSEVVATALVTAVNGQAGSRVAHLKIQEVLKGKYDKSFVDASFIENDLLCGLSVIYELNAEYILYFKKNPIGEGLIGPGQLKVSSKGTIENIKRFIRIAATEDMDKWRTPYLEIFQSGEYEFFMEAYKALANLNVDKNILEKGLLDQWAKLSGEDWKRSELIEPLLDLKSQAAIPVFKEMAQHGSSWLFREDAMRALITLKADNLLPLFMDIARNDADGAVRQEAYKHIADFDGKDVKDYLYDAFVNEKDPRARPELLKQLAELHYPAAYELALKAFTSGDAMEKQSACIAFAALRDARAYPLLLKEFDKADLIVKRSLMAALIAIDDEAASQFLISRLDDKDALNIIRALGNSKSPIAFRKLSERLMSELAKIPEKQESNYQYRFFSEISVVIQSLIEIDYRKAQGIVLPLLKNSNYEVKSAVINTLDRLKSTWAFDALQEQLSDQYVREIAAAALLKIDYEKAILIVTSLLEENKLSLTPDMRALFTQHKDLRSLPILEEALHDTDNSLSRSYLQDAILKIKSGTASKEAN